MNKQEAQELAKDAISWAELLTTTLDGLKIDAVQLSSLQDQVEDIRR